MSPNAITFYFFEVKMPLEDYSRGSCVVQIVQILFVAGLLFVYATILILSRKLTIGQLDVSIAHSFLVSKCLAFNAWLVLCREERNAQEQHRRRS